MRLVFIFMTACLVSRALVAQQVLDDSTRRVYRWSGEEGGIRGPVSLSGVYELYAHAAFYKYKHPYSSQCYFVASLRGLDHPVLPDGTGSLGTGLGIADLPHFRRTRFVTLQEGRYELWVSPQSDCSWEVSVFPVRIVDQGHASSR